ncbi:5-hydroxyisourate hydrolase isoform X1 [Cryptotermes secundus]|uniref:5-hydroxyisourate hydrolase isoform X1 n=1 Tax=Cryptotermes secundus TaxID=105785 RepID=UPI000CD7C416|nr:5-hydroxyisourate hydrolase isoform X1 [Cryptotermes secundus]
MSKREGSRAPRYFQFYNGEWEKLPIFKGWLAPVPDNRHKAFCKYCKKEFRAHRTDLRTHARSRKHQKAGDMYFSDSKKDENPDINSQNVADIDRSDVNSSDGWDEGDANVAEVEDVPPPCMGTMACMQLMSAENQTVVSGGVSTQVLDLVRGVPVSRMAVTLWLECGNSWTQISEGITDADGRCTNLLQLNEIVAGRYKMHFEVKKYFTLGLHDTFYPFIEVTFDVSDPLEQYHVPLLLSPFGYMVYRGR